MFHLLYAIYCVVRLEAWPFIIRTWVETVMEDAEYLTIS